MTKPTITHIIAADGSRLTVTTRVLDGVLHIDVYPSAQSSAAPLLAGRFTAKPSAGVTASHA